MLSDLLATVERRRPGIYPHLHEAECLFVASDYGGEHRAARYQTISFLISDIADCAAWNSNRAQVRSQLLPDRRRMAYKNLGDGVRRRALPAFLDIANALPGVLITFIVHKLVRSLFSTNTRIDVSELESTPLEGLSTEVAEKALRVVHLLSLLLAGFSAPGQNVLWATDEDSIAANESRVRCGWRITISRLKTSTFGQACLR